MTDFQKDMEILINNDVLVGKRNKIRFVFRHEDRIDKDIDELLLSTRSYNCLRRAGITCIKELGDRWDKLSRIKTGGHKTIKEIKNAYMSYYYDNLDKKEKEQFWLDTIEATLNI